MRINRDPYPLHRDTGAMSQGYVPPKPERKPTALGLALALLIMLGVAKLVAWGIPKLLGAFGVHV